MAVPLTVAQMQAAEVASQTLKDPGAQQVKQGSSKFDGMLADRAGQANGPGGVAQASNVQEVQHVSETIKADKSRLDSVHLKNAKANDPVTAKQGASKNGGMLHELVSGLEKGQGMMEKLIQRGVSGKNFSNTELLVLQASVFKYTQELELTGKVVEKATTGLKDTLKTQV